MVRTTYHIQSNVYFKIQNSLIILLLKGVSKN